MFYTAQNPTWRQTAIDYLLKSMMTLPTAVLLTAPKVHLLGSAVQIDKDTPLATLQAAEIAYTGYTAIVLPPLLGPVNSVPNMQAMYGDVQFLAPNPLATTATAFGYWVDGMTPADWVMAEEFPNSFPFAEPGDFLDLDLLFGLPFMLLVS